MNKSKIIGACIGIMIGFPMSAQEFSIGPEVGYERACHQLSGDRHSDVRAHSGNGIRIGATASYTFTNNLFLRTGLHYSHRGGIHIYGVNDHLRLPYVQDVSLRTVDYLTFPVAVGYEIPFRSKWGIGIEAGGYVASGLGGGSSFFRCTNGEGSGGDVFQNSSFTVATPDGTDRTEVTIKGSGRIDAGCLFGAHVRFDRIKIHASYQLGLCKTIYDMAIPRIFILSLSYDFKL